MLLPFRHSSKVAPKYLTLSLGSVLMPFHEILKFDSDFNFILDPNNIDSVLPICRDSLLSMSQSLATSSSFLATSQCLIYVCPPPEVQKHPHTEGAYCYLTYCSHILKIKGIPIQTLEEHHTRIRTGGERTRDITS